MNNKLLGLAASLFALTFIAAGCASPIQKACKNLEGMAEESDEADEMDNCEEQIAELGEQCPEAYDDMLGCLADAEGEDGVGECMGACMSEALAAAFAGAAEEAAE